MARFDFQNSNARKNFRYKKSLNDGVFGVITTISIVIVFLCLVIIFLPVTFFENLGLAQNVLNGLAQIVLAFILTIESYFLAKKYTRSKISDDNIVDFFSDDLIELFEKTIEEAKKEDYLKITPEYFFSKMTLVYSGQILCMRLGLPFVSELKKKPNGTEPIFDESLIQIASEIFDNKKDVIGVEDFFDAIVQNSEIIQEFLTKFQINKLDVSKVCEWLSDMKRYSKKLTIWDERPATAGIGEDWSYGYTPTLSRYAYDMTDSMTSSYDINLFSRAHKLSELQTVLCKGSKNNVLLVGEPGVGKDTIVRALATKLYKGDCLKPLKFKRIKQFDTGQLLAGANTAELAYRINRSLLEAINAGNVILYIENFQTLVGGSGREEVGGIDATQILLPYLENSKIRIIASITPDDYFSRLRTNAAVASAFEKIDVTPTNSDDTLSVILDMVGAIEHRYNVYVPIQSIKTIIKLSDRYMHDVPFPEKAIRLLEEVSTNFNTGKTKIITSKDVEELVSKKANVPVGQVAETEKKKLLNLEEFLHKRVIGQDEAVKAVSDSLRRVRAGLSSGKRPAGVFLFLGPTGVGKTETAKALAETYFGSEKRMIRLDMSEYQQPNSIDRLVGSTFNPNGVLTNAILENPFSLILLDEIEKADKNILNLFLQVFEDGRLTDIRGRVSDFTNTIIIATSNAGSELIRQKVMANDAQNLKKVLVEDLQQKGTFSPEFLNRYDNVIVFKPLTNEEIKKVATLMIDSINTNLRDRNIKIEVAEDALDKLVEIGYDPQFGARPMRRVIQEKIENLLAKKMLSNELQDGASIKISLEDIS